MTRRTTMSNIGAGRRTGLAAVVAVAVLGAGLAGCAKAPEKEGSLGGQDAQPAKLVAVPGSTLHRGDPDTGGGQAGRHRDHPGRAGADGCRADHAGRGWRPTPAPHRHRDVTVHVGARIRHGDHPGDRGHLRPGRQRPGRTRSRPTARTCACRSRSTTSTAPTRTCPPAAAIGTPVVSQGAPELLGVEYGVGEE